MSRTKHIQQRMNQRGITSQMLEIVKMFGVDDGDKTYINRKGLDAALTELNKLSQQMQKMRSRGGIVLVESGGTEITTYALESYSRSQVSQQA